ncbi:MAG: hypothetical protein IT267_07850 [Saprospiraceae bacterium]|nr:hypothetical protein [Saprospiraceae bacterium]
MKPYQVNLFVSFVLVIVGLWSYEASGRDFHTLSVPLIGILMSLFHRPLKANNLKFLKGSMALTMIIFILMLLPLRNTLIASNLMGATRIMIILLVLGFALVWYLKYFRSKT